MNAIKFLTSLNYSVIILILSLITFSTAGKGNNELLEGLLNNDIELFETALEDGISPDSKNEYGMPVIILSAVNGYLEFVQLLLEQDADVNAINNDGATALHYIALNTENNTNEHSIVELFLSNGADVDIKDGNGDTPLTIASYRAKSDLAKLLIDAGADVSEKNNRDFTALMLAVQAGNIELVKTLLDAGADVHADRLRGGTALSVASDKGFVELAEILLNHGADINFQDAAGGLTPLHFAAYMGKTEMVEFLVERGADATIIAQNGYTGEQYIDAMNEMNSKNNQVSKNEVNYASDIQKDIGSYEPEVYTAYSDKDVMFFISGTAVTTSIRTNKLPPEDSDVTILLKSTSNRVFKISDVTTVSLKEAITSDGSIQAYVVNNYKIEESGIVYLNSQLQDDGISLKDLIAKLRPDDFIVSEDGSTTRPDPRQFEYLRSLNVYNFFVEDADSETYPVQLIIETMDKSSSL